MAKLSWCPCCKSATLCDLDRCIVCGTRKNMLTGPVCTCTPHSRDGAWTLVRNPRCPAHGKIAKSGLRAV